MDQNPPTFAAVPPPGQIEPYPSRNGGLNDIESGYPMNEKTQQAVPIYAGNPTQVFYEAPKSGCNGPCCIPLQTACLVIGVLEIISVLADVLIKIIGLGLGPILDLTPPLVLLADHIIIRGGVLNLVVYSFLVLLISGANVLLIIGSKIKISVLLIIHMIVIGIYVLTLSVLVFLISFHDGMYLYFDILLDIYFLVVVAFYYKELNASNTPQQGQVYMSQAQMSQGQGQGLGLVTPGPSQISWSPSQANGQSGQVIGLPEQGKAVGSSEQGQEYGQSN